MRQNDTKNDVAFNANDIKKMLMFSVEKMIQTLASPVDAKQCSESREARRHSISLQGEILNSK